VSALENISEKQLKTRLRHLSDKIESIWEGVQPKLQEFSECKKEWNEIMEELLNREQGNK
jgi:hypothetical protein